MRSGDLHRRSFRPSRPQRKPRTLPEGRSRKVTLLPDPLVRDCLTKLSLRRILNRGRFGARDPLVGAGIFSALKGSSLLKISPREPTALQNVVLGQEMPKSAFKGGPWDSVEGKGTRFR